MSLPFLIYGANGFTGRLVAEAAKERGLDAVLAGRNERAVRELAERLSLEARVFSLDDAAAVRQGLDGMGAVLHCAGPFSQTSRPMLDACLARGVHYLDITGELTVFESVFARHAEIERAGVVALPGAGFDVVPTDCLAVALANELPGAQRLVLGLSFGGGLTSPGTAKTGVEILAGGLLARRGGVLGAVPREERLFRVPFSDKERLAVAFPWGDISTAYWSTGIPNITDYVALGRSTKRVARMAGALSAAFRVGPLRRLVQELAHRTAKGPGEEARESGRTRLYGHVEDAAGERVAMELSTPEGYRHTVDASLACTLRVLDGGVAPGAQTAGKAFGGDFVLSLPGVTRTEPRRSSRSQRAS
jgi:short subunit dehydrogenase-like uncharacterized protein